MIGVICPSKVDAMSLSENVKKVVIDRAAQKNVFLSLLK
jgi:hypothetical protein